MTNAVEYFTAVVVDNDDPDQLGRLTLLVPGLSGDEEPWPDWIPPKVSGGAGPGAAGLWWIPPVDAIVLVELRDGQQVRWIGGEWGGVNTPPEFLTSNYPRRAGLTSPAGLHGLALDDDTGLLVQVVDPDDPEGIANYIAIDGAAREVKLGAIGGATVLMDDDTIALIGPGTDMITLHQSDGIVLAHSGGAELIALESGVIRVHGTDFQVVGGAITLTGLGGIILTSDTTGVSPTEPLVLGTSFLTDLALAVAEWNAGTIGGPNGAAFATNIATALASGAPYLSTVTETE